MAEENNTQIPQREAVEPASAGSARDTPRTDWREARSEGLHDEWCFSLCRQLERELNDCQKALEAANDKVARLQALYDCMDPKGFFARKIETILGQNSQLNQPKLD